MKTAARFPARAIALLGALTLGTLTPGPALAATPDAGAVERARVHFERGVQRYDEQDYRSALIEFERAYADAPARAVLLNIGQARYQLLDYAGALQALEDYVAQSPDGVADPRRALVDREMADLTDRVGRVAVQCEVDGAEVLVDDVTVATTPLAVALRVNAGRRRITVRRGGASAVRVVDVAAGDTAIATFVLAAPTTPPPAPGPARAEKVRTPARASASTYVGFATGAVGLAVGTTFGILALDRKSSLDRACVDKACAPERASDIDALRRDATVSTIGYAVAVAGLGVGVVSLFLNPRSHEGAPASAAVHPYVSAGTVGVLGRF